MDPDELFTEVQTALSSRKGDWKRIAEEVPDVSLSWVEQVGRGHYHSAPTYKRLAAVARWLRANPAETQRA